MIRRILRRADDANWRCPKDMHPLLHRLLLTRGVTSDEEARAFMQPGKQDLRDPFLLSDMAEAVAVINDTIAKDEGICVYGDYDVDGVCASAILTLYLKEISARCEVYLPSRHNEGYGLNEDAIDKISKDYQLLLTVDCGITAHDLVEYAKSKGMRVVITDHHRPDDRLPECPVVNPLLNNYPFGYLCGTGVAFQLVTALAGRDKAMEYIDLAALATIADIVPLRDENRVIASLGLKKINFLPRLGVRALIDASGLTGKMITAGNVAFQMTPRLNASGRMGDAKRAYDLLTGTDAEKCAALAQELNLENDRRKAFENAAINEADEKLKDFDFVSKRVLIIKGEDWNPGVIGLAASRLTEKYNYPAVVLTRDGDSYIGSCRSIEGIDIQEALTHVADLMERFGGHKMAAGLKLKAEHLPEFERRLNEYLASAYLPETWIPAFEYDADVRAGELTIELIKQIEALAPTGCGNPGALFCMKGSIEYTNPVGPDGAHLKLTFRGDDGCSIGGIWFRNGALAEKLPHESRMLFAPTINSFQNRVTVQAEVRNIFPLDNHTQMDEALKREKELFAGFMIARSEQFSTEEVPECLASEALCALEAAPQGTLLVACDCKGAEAALSLNCDLTVGAYPGDSRAFTTVALAPCEGTPKGYKKVYYAGIPAFLCGGGVHVKNVPLSRWFAYLPDVDTLRDIYLAFRGLCRSTVPFRTIVDAVKRAAGLNDALPYALGLCVLRHMELLSTVCTEKGWLLRPGKRRKAEPDEDELYIALRQAIRKEK